MGKKRNIVMDESQQEELNQRSTNRYRSAYDLPEEFAMIAELDRKNSGQTETEEVTEENKPKARRQHVRSKKYLNLKKKVDEERIYDLGEAVKTVLALARERFDSSIELNIQMKKDNASGTIILPFGTGKEKKVVILTDELLAQIADKKIDFDVLIARPEDMPKLARHAKVLGPRGLMPNPKNGTVSANPEEAIKNFSSNNVSYKTEKKAPLIHLLVGKKSFGEDKLVKNITAALVAINPRTIKGAAISSSMGPGIKISLDGLSANA